MEDISRRSVLVVVGLAVMGLVIAGIGYVWRYGGREVGNNNDIDEASFTPPTLEEFVQEIAETPWDYETTEVNTTVMEVNRGIGMMLLYMTWPPPVPNYQQEVWVQVTCDPKTSRVTQGGRRGEPGAGDLLGTDVLMMAEVGDYLSGKCGEAGCETLANDCQLMKRVEEANEE